MANLTIKHFSCIKKEEMFFKTVIVLLLYFSSTIVSALWIPQIFSSNMVLPRDKDKFCIIGKNQQINIPISVILKNLNTGESFNYISTVSHDYAVCFTSHSFFGTLF